jgi:hypothetical protein
MVVPVAMVVAQVAETEVKVLTVVRAQPQMVIVGAAHFLILLGVLVVEGEMQTLVNH